MAYCLILHVVLHFSTLLTFEYLVFPGARVRVEPEIQRREVHNRTGSHGERERVGLGGGRPRRP